MSGSSRNLARLSIATYLFADILAYAVTMTPWVLAASAVLRLYSPLHARIPLVLAVAAMPPLFFAVFLAALLAVRLCLPRLRAGTFPVGFHRDFVAWSLHNALNRA